MTSGLVGITNASRVSTGKIITNVISEPGIFKNFVLGMVGLSCAANVNYAYPADLTTNGYPINGALITSNISAPFRFPSFLSQSDVMVVAWKGTCSNSAGGFGGFALRRGAPGFTVISDTGLVVKQYGTNLELQGTDGYVEFQFTTSLPAASSGVTLSYNGGSSFSNNFRDLIVCRKTDYASVVAAMANNNPGAMVTDEFVATYLALNPRALRFMGPIQTNFSNFAQSRYLPNWQTSICGGGGVPIYPSGCWAGSDSTNTGAYTVSLPPDSAGLSSYYDGEVIICQLQLASTGNVTLNSGGRGAVTVYQGQGGSTGLVMDSSSSSLKILGYASDGKCGVCTFVYSSLIGAFFHISDGPGVSPIMAYEFQAAICNRVGCDLYTNFPFHATDSSITAITQIVRDTLKPGLKAYFEYCNEIWNSNYRQTPKAALYGRTLGFTNDGNTNVAGWVGLRSLIIHKLATAAWSPRTAAQLKRVIAFAATHDNSPTGTTYVNRLKGAQLAPSGTGTGGLGAGNAAYSTYCAAHTVLSGTDFTAYPNRPADWCDVLSYAPYYNAAHIMQYPTHYVQAFGGNNAPQNTITGISKASPGRVTSTAHGYADHDRIVFDATVGGMVEIRGLYASVKFFDANNYDLYQDFDLTVPLDTTLFTTYTSGGKTQRQPDMTGFVQAAKDYEAGNTATAFSWIDTDYLSGTNNDAGNTNNLNLAYYNGTASTSPYKSFETTAAALEASGSSAKTIECYEGGSSSDVPDIPALYLQGLTKQSTITFNASTGPSVNWTNHPLKNGYVVGFTVSGGSLPSNLGVIQYGLTISGVGVSGNGGYYVVNATTNGFDISASYGGSPITPASTGTGTITATASQYGFTNVYWNYKLSSNFKTTVLRQFHQFMGDYVGDNNFGALTHSYSPTVFMVVGPNAWSMSTGDSFAAKFTNWDASVAYNLGLG